MPDSGKPKQSAPSDFLYTHDNSDKRYLVQAVKLARSQGYVGSQGSWSAFVKVSICLGPLERMPAAAQSSRSSCNALVHHRLVNVRVQQYCRLQASGKGVKADADLNDSQVLDCLP